MQREESIHAVNLDISRAIKNLCARVLKERLELYEKKKRTKRLNNVCQLFRLPASIEFYSISFPSYCLKILRADIDRHRYDLKYGGKFSTFQ